MAKHRWTNEEIADFRKAHDGFGYVNKEDTRIFVPKAYGIGVTMNWGNPIAWVVVAAILILVCVKLIIK